MNIFPKSVIHNIHNMLCMTDFEKKHLQLKPRQGCVISKYLSVHTRDIFLQWALKLKSALLIAEN